MGIGLRTLCFCVATTDTPIVEQKPMPFSKQGKIGNTGDELCLYQAYHRCYEAF